MTPSSIIILAIGVAALALLSVWLFKAPKESKTIVQIDKSQSVKIDPIDDGGVKIQILYNSWEERPSDDELFPDMPNNAETPDPIGASFWGKVISFDSLPEEEKEEVKSILEKEGFFRKDNLLSELDKTSGNTPARFVSDDMNNIPDMVV